MLIVVEPLLPLPAPPLLDDGVRGNCSSLFGVVDDEVGVGNADVIVTVETCPIIGEDPSIMGDCKLLLALPPPPVPPPPVLEFDKMVAVLKLPPSCFMEPILPTAIRGRGKSTKQI